MTSPPTYDLIDRPWIRVRSMTGDLHELSLSETFARASELRGLAGEVASQDAALLRLLLAIMLGASRTAQERSDEESVELWASWWNGGAPSLVAAVMPYLDAHRSRFDLLHPETPFLQVASLTTESGKRSGLGKLIADLPDGHPFFTTRSGAALESLTLTEAARWLVHCQAFDPSGIKTGAVGDDRVKGGKGYPFGYPAWAGNLGLVFAEGATLFETLMLNLPLDTSGPDDLPVWERAPLGPGVEVPAHSPTGPADMFTWPSRRLRLFVEDERVVDVQISNGDKLGPQNLHPFEPMCAWRVSANQSKGGSQVLMPVMHQPDRRIWQGLGALLQSGGGPDRRAHVIDWLAALRDWDRLEREHPVDLRIVGLEYGPQNSTITATIDDRLTAPVTALTAPVLAQCAIAAAEAAYHGVQALVNLGGNLDRAAGLDGPDHARETRYEVGYALLDRPFRRWIRTLTDPELTADRLEAWASEAFDLLLRAGRDLIADAGPAALVGRQVTRRNSDDTELLDAGLAAIWFRSALWKALPHPVPEKENAHV